MTVTTAGRSAFLTYEPYYGLKEKPFSLSADPRFLYKSQAHAPTFEALRAGIRRREGLIVLTGEPGTGKTTLCRSVLEALDRKTFCTLVPDPFVSREDLLKMLLIDFGVMSVEDLRSGRLQGLSRPELSYPLYEFLKSLVPLQAYAVLIIDEAQNLAPQLLEEIRILADLEAPEKLLQLVLVGQPELRAKLKDFSMRQVDHRVSVRVELTALDRVGVSEYIAHRLNVAGAGTDRVTFADDAVDAIFKATKGNPRLINVVGDKALHHGHLARTFTIGPEIVSRAVSELGMPDVVPAPRSAPAPLRASAPPPASPPLPASASQRASAPPPASPPLPASASQRASAPPPASPPLPASASQRDSASLPVWTPPPASAPLAMVPAPAMRPDPASPSASAPLLAPDSEPTDDFGLNDKFFERPRSAPEDSVSLDDDAPAPHLLLGDTDTPPSGRRRTLLLVLVGILALALAALLIWAWQRQSPVGDVAPAPPSPPATEAAQPQTPPPTESVGQSVAADPANQSPTNQSATNQSFEVGVALFAGYERANRLAVSLAASGFRATTRPFESAGGRMFEVRTGPYLSREEAEADASVIRKMPGYSDARVIAPTATTSVAPSATSSGPTSTPPAAASTPAAPAPAPARPATPSEPPPGAP